MHEYICMCLYALSGANQLATLHEVEDNYLVKHFRDEICGKKLCRIFYRNDLEDPKQKKIVFVSNNTMEMVNQHGLIQNMIQIQYSTN
uniref:Ycf2 N-terminal domain-containing protein n=1 Tax=Populus trichocarpa TaxID=3694 RepID=A0A2K2B564_POPTR